MEGDEKIYGIFAEVAFVFVINRKLFNVSLGNGNGESKYDSRT